MGKRGRGEQEERGRRGRAGQGERGKGHWLLGTLRNFQPPC